MVELSLDRLRRMEEAAGFVSSGGNNPVKEGVTFDDTVPRELIEVWERHVVATQNLNIMMKKHNFF